jgi:antitoxin ChpS
MSASHPAGKDLYAPPDDATVDQAVQDFARAVRKSYGPRVKGIYLFGSRARGDHTPNSDADVAVVLSDGDWREWPETKRLTNIAYDLIVETGAALEAWPVRASEWEEPSVQRESGAHRSHAARRADSGRSP